MHASKTGSKWHIFTIVSSASGRGGGFAARPPTRGKVGLCPVPPLDAGNASSAISSASECSGDNVNTDVENSDDVEERATV